MMSKTRVAPTTMGNPVIDVAPSDNDDSFPLKLSSSSSLHDMSGTLGDLHYKLSWSRAFHMVCTSRNLQFVDYGAAHFFYTHKSAQKMFINAMWYPKESKVKTFFRLCLCAWVSIGMWFLAFSFVYHYKVNTFFGIGMAVSMMSGVGKMIIIHTSVRKQDSNNIEKLGARGIQNGDNCEEQVNSVYANQPFFTAYKFLQAIIIDNDSKMEQDQRELSHQWGVKSPQRILDQPADPRPILIAGLFSLLPLITLPTLGWIWNMVPTYVSILILSILVLVFSTIPFFLNVAMLTTFFFRSSDAAVYCIENLAIFSPLEEEKVKVHMNTSEKEEEEKEGSDTKPENQPSDLNELEEKAATKEKSLKRNLIDWEETFDNFNLMHNFVEQFSHTWFFFFFVVEFTMILGGVIMTIGFWLEAGELLELVTSSSTHDGEAVVFGVCKFCVTFPAGIYLYIMYLWRSASNITEACRRLREKSLIMKSQMKSEFDMQQADRFYAYVIQNDTGFRGNGWTISYHLATAILYPAATILAAVIPLQTIRI